MKRNGSVRGSQRGRGSSGRGRGGTGGRGGRQKKAEPADPTEKDKKDKERRFSNNTRERMRIKDINLALNELGHICKNIKPEQLGGSPRDLADATDESKPNTKLGVLNMAVEVITMLERKVKERNMSPATLCLQNQGTAAPPPQQLQQQQQQQLQRK